MATITTVRLTQGSIIAIVELTYRWYAPGNDPWAKIVGSPTSIPASGDWENRMVGGSTSEVRMSSPSVGYCMRLMNFTRVRVGSTGDGEFFVSGYGFREFSTFEWDVMGIS